MGVGAFVFGNGAITGLSIFNKGDAQLLRGNDEFDTT